MVEPVRGVEQMKKVRSTPALSTPRRSFEASPVSLIRAARTRR